MGAGPRIIMTHDTAFLGASTVFGKYWTAKEKFDYLIDKENFRLTFGKCFRKIVYLDNAIANGPALVRQDAEADTRATNYLINHLADIKPEFTVFVTTCDMLAPNADENSPVLEQSDDPYVQNRINLYRELNRQYGRVLNVHLPEVALPSADYSPLLATLLNPPQKGKLPFAPGEKHQFYFPKAIFKDVRKCIPLGIGSIIPAPPPLTTREVVEAVAPELLSRLPEPTPEDPQGADRTSIHSFQWSDPKDGYLLYKEDQVALLQFHMAVYASEL